MSRSLNSKEKMILRGSAQERIVVDLLQIGAAKRSTD
jgi:hypothetical protein